MKKKFKDFLAEKGITEEGFAKKSAEEMADLYAEHQEKVAEEMTAALEAKASKEDIEALKDELVDTQQKQMDAVQKALKAHGKALAEILDANRAKPISEQKTAFRLALEGRKEDIEKLMNKEIPSMNLESKAFQVPSDIDSGLDFAEMESGIGKLPYRRPVIKSLFPTRNTSKEYVKYTDQDTVVRDAKNIVACAETTHDSKVTWIVTDMQIKKIRDFVDVCLDMMDDYDFIEGEIRDLININVMLKVDEQLLLGDGTGNNLNSIDSNSVAFAAGTYASAVQSATLIDLIVVCGGLISDAGQNNMFVADTALMNPADALLMKLEKDANNNYLIPNFVTSEGVDIGAIRVVTTPLVTANTMYVFDSTKGLIYQRRNNLIEFGFENNNNFEHEVVTVKGYERLNFRVKNADFGSFLKVADIANAIAAITE